MNPQTPADPGSQDTSLWVDPRASMARDLQQNCPDPATLDETALRRLVADYRQAMRLILDLCNEYAKVDAERFARDDQDAATPPDRDLLAAILLALPLPEAPHPDDRDTAAAEYLATPEWCADAGRIVLHWLTAARQQGVLTDAQREILAEGLADGIAWREDPEPCGGCARHPGGECEHHAGEAAQIARYRELARSLGLALSAPSGRR